MIRLFFRFNRDRRRICKIVARLAQGRAPAPDELISLILLLEDKRFWRHRGVDVLACFRAFINWARGCPRGGASTIDMQLVRTITNYRAKTVPRKLYELVLALAIRMQCGPASILNAYLSIAYFGNSAVGIDAVAQRLFGHAYSSCGLEQFSQLASLLRYPVPATSSQKWRRRMLQRARLALLRYDSTTGLGVHKAEALRELQEVELTS